MDTERERRASQPAFKINPTNISHEHGGVVWIVDAENIGSVEARGASGSPSETAPETKLLAIRKAGGARGGAGGL